MTTEELQAEEATELGTWASAWGLRIESLQMDTRPDGMGEWGDGASHFKCTLHVTAPGDATERLLWAGHYSQGAAYRLWTIQGVRRARQKGYGADTVGKPTFREAGPGDPVDRTKNTPDGKVRLTLTGPPVQYNYRRQKLLAELENEAGNVRATRPEPLAVLESILSDAMSAADSVPFVEWAGDLGYELGDYEKAHAAYTACQATYRTALSVLGRAELERVGELER